MPGARDDRHRLHSATGGTTSHEEWAQPTPDHPRQRRPAARRRQAAGGTLIRRARPARDLDATLSSDSLLLARLAVLDPPGRERLYGRLGVETGRTVRSALRGTEGRQATPRTGTTQVWEWKALGRTEQYRGNRARGREVRPADEHWEPPWLDTSALADDLKMRPECADCSAASGTRLVRSAASPIRSATLPSRQAKPAGMDGRGDIRSPDLSRMPPDWERRVALGRPWSPTR